MLKYIHIIMFVALFCLLSACASVNSTNSEEQARKVKTAKINAQLGIAYLERRNLQRAKQKLLLALEQGPTIPEPWYSMAYFLEATGNKDDASIYYQKAISVAPTRGDAQNNYGTFLCRNGDYRGSIEHFMLAVKDPTYLDPADAYENAGLCALKIPDKTMATKYFSQALQQDPSRMVSERKLRELNQYLAMNDTSTDDTLMAPVVTSPPPKRIAYHSLKQRHEEEENEDEADSGLVKVPDLLKARPNAPVTTVAPTKAVYIPALKAKLRVKPKVVTAKAKATSELFHVERVALKPIAKKKVALKSGVKRNKAVKLAAKFKHKRLVASAKPAHATAKKQVPVKGMVTV